MELQSLSQTQSKDKSYRGGKGAKDFRDEGCVRNVRREREVTETERKDGREEERNGKKASLSGAGWWRKLEGG